MSKNHRAWKVLVVMNLIEIVMLICCPRSPSNGVFEAGACWILFRHATNQVFPWKGRLSTLRSIDLYTSSPQCIKAFDKVIPSLSKGQSNEALTAWL